MIFDLLKKIATNEIVQGFSTSIGIIGFILTIFVSVKTKKISKILKYNDVISTYNSERIGYQNTFEGHRKSIIDDNIKTNVILKDILKNVESYRVKFYEILSLREKISLYFFKILLKRDAKDVDFNKVCNYLSILSGRLSKKENIRND